MAKRHSQEEKRIFLEVLPPHVGTLEVKRSEDWVTTGKNATWTAVANDYYEMMSAQATVEGLMEEHKSKAKKNYANLKKESRRTGGGPAPTAQPSTPYQHLLLKSSWTSWKGIPTLSTVIVVDTG